MNESIYKDIFLNNVIKYGRNHLGVDIVDLYNCKDGTILAISSNYKFTVVSTDPLFELDPSTPHERVIEIENTRGILPLSSIFEEEYDEVNRCFIDFGYSIDEVLDLKLLIKKIFSFSPYRAIQAFEWVKASPFLSFNDFTNEINKMLRSDSYTRNFRSKLREELLKESVQTG